MTASFLLIYPPPREKGDKIKMELYNEVLYHHGVKGMRWGVRRYQNKDGSLTDAGKARLAAYSATKDKKDIRTEYESERSKINNMDRVDANIYTNEYIRKYAQTTLKELGLNDNHAAIADANRLLRKVQLKNDIDAKSEINELVKDGYRLNYDDYSCSVNKNIRGVDTNIVISTMDGHHGVARIMDKPTDFVNSVNKTLEKEFSSITNEVTKDLYRVYKEYAQTPTMDRMSESEFISRIEPYYIRVSKSNGRRICEMGFDDGDMLGGHSLDVEFDLDAKDRKYYHSMNG